MDILRIPPGHALAVITRMPESSLKTTTRVKRGRRCSLRRYDMAFVPMPGLTLADRPRAYAYADGDLSHEVAKVARSGSFTALLHKPHTQRPVIVAIVDHAQAAATARKARMAIEDAEWEAQAPAHVTRDRPSDGAI
jgi:hypothetical protein